MAVGNRRPDAGPARRPRRASSARPGGPTRPGRRAGRSAGRSSATPPPATGGGAFARRSTRRLAALGAVFVLLAMMIVPTLRAYLQQEAEYSALQDRVVAQERSVAQLTEQTKRWNDPAYIEQQARERLKFVRPGETAYQVIGAEKLLGDPAAGRANVVSPHRGDDGVPWYGKMWSSIEMADRPRVDTSGSLVPVGAEPTAPGGAGGSSGTAR